MRIVAALAMLVKHLLAERRQAAPALYRRRAGLLLAGPRTGTGLFSAPIQG